MFVAAVVGMDMTVEGQKVADCKIAAAVAVGRLAAGYCMPIVAVIADPLFRSPGHKAAGVAVHRAVGFAAAVGSPVLSRAPVVRTPVRVAAVVGVAGNPAADYCSH